MFFGWPRASHNVMRVGAQKTDVMPAGFARCNRHDVSAALHGTRCLQAFAANETIHGVRVEYKTSRRLRPLPPPGVKRVSGRCLSHTAAIGSRWLLELELEQFGVNWGGRHGHTRFES